LYSDTESCSVKKRQHVGVPGKTSASSEREFGDILCRMSSPPHNQFITASLQGFAPSAGNARPLSEVRMGST
jgi:hypothetical protein